MSTPNHNGNGHIPDEINDKLMKSDLLYELSRLQMRQDILAKRVAPETRTLMDYLMKQAQRPEQTDDEANDTIIAIKSLTMLIAIINAG